MFSESLSDVPLQTDLILVHLNKDHRHHLAKLEIFNSLPSTNDYLLDKISTATHENIACFAEMQTKGKGRQGRVWISPFGKNIYLSLLWHFQTPANLLSHLSLAVGLSIIETLHNIGLTHPIGIKWPNDVYVNHQKLSGILIECPPNTQRQKTCSAVIGIGLNVNMPNHHQYDIHKPWIDLQTLTGTLIDRNALAGQLLNNLIRTLLIYASHGFSAFAKYWKQFDLTLNQPVSLVTPKYTFSGIGRGINAEGHFLLEVAPGGIHAFPSAEVSLRLSG